MKKLLLLLLIFPLAFVSCSSDDDKDQGLNGTTWEQYVSVGTGFSYKHVLTFSKSTMKLSGYVESNGKREDVSESGKYTYNHPNLVLKWTGGDTFEAIISGDKITLIDEEGVYIKK